MSVLLLKCSFIFLTWLIYAILLMKAEKKTYFWNEAVFILQKKWDALGTGWQSRVRTCVSVSVQLVMAALYLMLVCVLSKNCHHLLGVFYAIALYAVRNQYMPFQFPTPRQWESKPVPLLESSHKRSQVISIMLLGGPTSVKYKLNYTLRLLCSSLVGRL